MSVSLAEIQAFLAATRVGDFDLVEKLLNKEPYLSIASDYDGISALHVACGTGNIQMIHYLVGRGANVNSRNVDGATPLNVACSRGCLETTETLLKYGSLSNLSCQLNTPLHEAAANGHVECCEVVLAHGGQLEVSDCWLGTPLQSACFRGQTATVKVLLDAGAKVNARFIHKSPLHYAVEQCPSKPELSILLLLYGADLHARDNQGRTCADMAFRNVHLRDFLLHLEQQPRSLQDLCRIGFVRNRDLRLKLQANTTLPLALQNFLNCEELLKGEYNIPHPSRFCS